MVIPFMYNSSKMNKDMNKDMIKSLRQAMLSTAAAALVSIGFMACSNETFITQNPSAPAGSYQVCIPANIGGGGTRAIAYNSETGGYDATFETTDNIYVLHVGQKFYSNNPLKPESDGQFTNLIGNLSFDTAPTVGDELQLFYNGTSFWYSRDFSKGDTEADYALATVTITSIDDGKITTSAATFQNVQSIYKINFTGIPSDVKIKKVTIESEQRKLVSSYYPMDMSWFVNFGDVTYIYKDNGTAQHELTFLLHFANNPNNADSSSGDIITFMALGSDGHFYSGTKPVTKDLEDSKCYKAEVAMADLGLAMTLTNNTTGELLDFSNYVYLSTINDSYTAKNNGYGTCIEWYGGDQKLILKDLTMYNSNDGDIAVKSDPNAEVHNLVLEGVNTLNVTGYHTCITVQTTSSLIISSPSSGKLILKAEDAGMSVWDGSKGVIIESGEVTIDGRLAVGSNSSVVITNSGKLRVLTQKNYSSEGIKAGSGYVLQTATEGDYTVYTVTEAPEPKALSEVTTADLGSIIGSDEKVYLPNCGLPEGVTPVGMIANISSTGHGLAVSVSRIQVEYDSWSTTESFTWDNTGYGNNGKTALEILDDWKANNSVSFGTWRLATKTEWQNMVISCGIDGDAIEAGDEMVAEGLTAALKQVGICRDGFERDGGFESWIGESDIEGMITSMSIYNSWQWDEDKQEGYQGPAKLWFNYSNADAEPDFKIYRNILPVLEF